MRLEHSNHLATEGRHTFHLEMGSPRMHLRHPKMRTLPDMNHAWAVSNLVILYLSIVTLWGVNQHHWTIIYNGLNWNPESHAAQ